MPTHTRLCIRLSQDGQERFPLDNLRLSRGRCPDNLSLLFLPNDLYRKHRMYPLNSLPWLPITLKHPMVFNPIRCGPITLNLTTTLTLMHQYPNPKMILIP